jgi:hAT family C-terminal dimerisation region/BED zinc finger
MPGFNDIDMPLGTSLDTTLDISSTTAILEASQAMTSTTTSYSDIISQGTTGSHSGIWVHYNRAAGYATNRRVSCIYCAKSYVSSNSSTSNMWKHIKRVHPDKIVGKSATTTSVAYPSRGFVFNPAIFRQKLAKWIVLDDQPFIEIEQKSFLEMVASLNPGAEVPAADTICRDLGHLFEAEKRRVRGLLQDVPGCISFAIDSWTSPNSQAFLGITAHWIDHDWTMQSLLLNLVPLRGSHSGANLCSEFIATCQDFGVLTKLRAITTDNASNNNTFVEVLEAFCQQQGISFDANLHHVRCIAHVINLAVHDFLGSIHAEVLESEDEYEALPTTHPSFTHSIPRLRQLLVKVRGSPQRRERFERQCEGDGLCPKALKVDVRTRWNSTYDMIVRALELRQPLDDMAALDGELTRYRLDKREWELLPEVCRFLRVFKKASDHLCSAKHPTLTTAVPAYNYMIDKLEDLVDKDVDYSVIKNTAEVTMNKLKKYYFLTGAETYPVATILDPRLKLHWYRENKWEHHWINDAHASFERAFAPYRVSSEAHVQESLFVHPSSDGDDDVMDHIYKRPRLEQRDELKDYLDEPKVPSETRVLGWWQVHASKYPRLAMMARDYLAIPATGAPVERIFSGGVDLVAPKRGCLNEKTIQTCMCLKSWLKSASSSI